MEAAWQPVAAVLDRAAAAGRSVDVWLRDDDAVAATPALDRLTALCERHAMPVLLAVIPAEADDTLRRFVEAHPVLTPTQHGYAHRNHAAEGDRACELAGARPIAAALDDLALGRDRLGRLFGARATTILVPPWNRIDAALPAALPALGFRALSTFGPPGLAVPDLLVLNCNLDIVDWRGGRVCHPYAKLIGRLATLIETALAQDQPVGLLTHHLVHDPACWAFLETCLGGLVAHPAVRFTAADTLLSRTAAGTGSS